MNRKQAELGGRGDGDENQGPLENQIDNLQKQIKEVEDQTTEIQKEWITSQIELIKKQETKGKIDAENDDLLNQKIILDQKKLRINNEVGANNKAIRELEIAQKN